MGKQKYINRAVRRASEERDMQQRPDAVVFAKLNEFYKNHPKSTVQVKRDVDQIRLEQQQAQSALADRFEKESAELTARYMQKELDYVQSYVVDEGEPKTGLFGKAYKLISGLRPRT